MVVELACRVFQVASGLYKEKRLSRSLSRTTTDILTRATQRSFNAKSNQEALGKPLFIIA